MTTIDRLGVDLLVGDTVVDLAGEHVIDHFGTYPGIFVGDKARIAYYTNGEGEHTVCDHRHFNVVVVAVVVAAAVVLDELEAA